LVFPLKQRVDWKFPQQNIKRYQKSSQSFKDISNAADRHAARLTVTEIPKVRCCKSKKRRENNLHTFEDWQVLEFVGCLMCIFRHTLLTQGTLRSRVHLWNEKHLEFANVDGIRTYDPRIRRKVQRPLHYWLFLDLDLKALKTVPTYIHTYIGTWRCLFSYLLLEARVT
jgi:hypothetical protein